MPLGRAVYPRAKQALEALADVERVVELWRADGAQSLRLSASQTIGEFLLPGWLAEFRQLSPDVRPQLEISNSPGVLDEVREHHAEIGFVEGLDSLQAYESFTIAPDQLLVVVSSGHPWARRRTIATRELGAEPYLTREAASGDARGGRERARARRARFRAVDARIELSKPQASARWWWLRGHLRAHHRGRTARRYARRDSRPRTRSHQ
jgi:DNA-binding transcriptional LysR family regulator